MRPADPGTTPKTATAGGAGAPAGRQ